MTTQTDSYISSQSLNCLIYDERNPHDQMMGFNKIYYVIYHSIRNKNGRNDLNSDRTVILYGPVFLCPSNWKASYYWTWVRGCEIITLNLIFCGRVLISWLRADLLLFYAFYKSDFVLNEFILLFCFFYEKSLVIIAMYVCFCVWVLDITII